jgi:hypothetical protein
MESLLPDVTAERAKFGRTMTNDECVALLNAVAWKNRDEGWGLGKKTSGNRGRRSDGVECTVDGLVHRNTMTFVDALKDAGGKSEPAWQVAPNPSNRPWVAPIDPAGSSAGLAPPPPRPPPRIDLSELRTAIQALGSRVSVLEARLTALEARPVASLDEVLARLDALERAEYSIDTGTSRELGHAHTVQGTTVRVR